MSITVGQLAELVQGVVQGDASLVVQAARSLNDAQAGDITFVEQDRFKSKFEESSASAAVVSPSMTIAGKTVIQVADPLAAFVAIVKKVHGKPEPKPSGVDPRAFVHPTAQIGPDVSILPFACIGENAVIGRGCRIHSGVSIGRDCRLGDEVVLFPNVVLYDDTIVGDRSIMHAGAVIGSDGFGYRFQNGRHSKVPQLGRVEIGCDVEIGAAATIDRATFGVTRIGDGTKIDNLVQIAHNCLIGKHNIIVSQVGIAGSCTTGDYVVMAGQVGIADHVAIGTGAVIGAKAGVVRDLDGGQRYLGAPATPEREQKRILLSLDRLPELIKDVREIKKRLDNQEPLSKAG